MHTFYTSSIYFLFLFEFLIFTILQKLPSPRSQYGKLDYLVLAFLQCVISSAFAINLESKGCVLFTIFSPVSITDHSDSFLGSTKYIFIERMNNSKTHLINKRTKIILFCAVIAFCHKILYHYLYLLIYVELRATTVSYTSLSPSLAQGLAYNRCLVKVCGINKVGD